jgi:hypothetical protein
MNIVGHTLSKANTPYHPLEHHGGGEWPGFIAELEQIACRILVNAI